MLDGSNNFNITNMEFNHTNFLPIIICINNTIKSI